MGKTSIIEWSDSYAKIIQIAGVVPLLLLAACGGESASRDHHSSAAAQKQSVSQPAKPTPSNQRSFVKVQTYMFKDDGTIPNNPTFPVLIYPGAFKGRTGHKRLSSSSDFSISGGYPNGQDYDTQTKETQALKDNIARVGKPEQDPVYGNQGPLLQIWKNK
ncbi:cupin [Sporolactobacillus laevolacticus]|uniref:Cupin n=1 Tax=Sporolactobacillus laevolacticus DSM 442 TaxID=1395513 RepID=V6IXP6_9BACL|nr:cupin [Sporolactobacillus laevolacticus]EST11456.1 cupin [Sporolactobacillus laevolacticus DSM 442]